MRLLLAAAAIYSSLQGQDQTIRVHEWGVVLVDEVIPMATGAPPGSMLEDPGPVLVDAPVIWFHGPDFTGTFSVELQDGFFSVLLPNPFEAADVLLDDREGSSTLARWNGLKCMSADAEDEYLDIPVGDGTEVPGWDTNVWRRVPSLRVIHPGTGYRDSFIYYECSASGVVEDPYQLPEGERIEVREYLGELMPVFIRDCSSAASDRTPLSEEEVLEVLARWGSGGFLEQEIRALWSTWEPHLETRCLEYGQAVAIYPLSPEQVERISSITLQPDQPFDVEYSRLFLAIASI